jgi:hypothetical protein
MAARGYRKTRKIHGQTDINRELLPWFPENGGAVFHGLVFDDFKIGDLCVFTRHATTLKGFPGRRAAPPFPYVVQAFSTTGCYPIVAKKGDVAVYMGELRVEEGITHSDVRRIIRHKFLMNGMICIIQEISIIMRVQSSSV